MTGTRHTLRRDNWARWASLRALAAWALLLCSVGACGQGDAQQSVIGPSDERRHNVLVIDHGIDVQSPAFEGKIVATYTLDCRTGPGPADGPTITPGTAIEDLKQIYITQLMSADQDCVLRPGIDAVPAPAHLGTVTALRDRWNQMLLNQQSATTVFSEAERVQVETAVDSELASLAYHGTATAGIIARENPEVRLVLVERRFDDKAATEGAFTCISQGELDLTVALLLDEEVRDAYVYGPAASSSLAIQSLFVDHGIGVVNRSYGQRPRAALESLQASKQCPPVDLVAYFSVLNAVQSARSDYLGGVAVLTTRSAGNEAAQVDSTADLFGCQGNSLELMVGSTDARGAPSFFSNHGECVDLLAPGENIIAPYAGGWLLPVAGTSFSSALVARLASQISPSPFDATQAREYLLNQGGSARAIPIAAFPGTATYSLPLGDGVTNSALVRSGASMSPSSPERVPGPVSSQVDPQRVLRLLLSVRADWP